MNKDWDRVVVSVDIWKECLRVLKPGAFAFIMCAPRQDVLSRQIVNLQDAGFETGFTSIYWTYASGFPKAKNLKNGSYCGFQPKPAVEIVLVVMKPLSEKSYVDQTLANKHGITWLDSCRIPYQSENDEDQYKRDFDGSNRGNQERFKNVYSGYAGFDEPQQNQLGRFPANLLVSDDVLNDGTITGGKTHFKNGRGWNNSVIHGSTATGTGFVSHEDRGSYSRYFDLDKWYDTTFPFLVTPKPSKREKNMGLDKWIPAKVNDGCKTYMDNPFQRGETPRQNTHPTVKSIKLMSYLIMLGSRENDVILDPFCGSGTTLIAAKMLRRVSVGIEISQDYLNIAKARLTAIT